MGEGQNGSNSSKNGVLNDMGLHIIDVGEGVNGPVNERQPLVRQWRNDLISHSKAVRRTAAYFKMGFGEREISALCILSAWCWVNNKPGGGIATIVGWSGYKRSWKARVYSGIDDCIKLGLMENVPMRAGHRLCISFKGERVLQVYDRFCDILSQENALKAVS